MELVFRLVDAFAGFFELAKVTFLSNSGHVVPLRQRTLPFMAATVADIRRVYKSRTIFKGEFAAQLIA